MSDLHRCENCCGDFLPGEGYNSEDLSLSLCRKCVEGPMSINGFMDIVEPDMDDLLRAFGFTIVKEDI